jgi:hypothetical protein
VSAPYFLKTPLGILTNSESTEVIHGGENIVKRMLEGYATCNETIDGCSDHSGPRAVVTTEPIFKLLNEHAKIGTRLQCGLRVMHEELEKHVCK